jgi:hypothetical protein
MTPEERADAIVDGILYEGWHGPRAREAIASAIREAYEDAAKIAEEAIDLGYRGGADKWAIAEAIRARITPRSTTPTGDHSKE